MWQSESKIYVELLASECAMYGIMRLQKIKSTYSLLASMRHSFREQETPNADPSRAEQNEFVSAYSVRDGMAFYQERLNTVGRVRKNAVHAIEYMISASPGWFTDKTIQEQNRYFKDALDWLKTQYGSENVVCAGVHRDETSPHLFAYVVPIKDGKLNARALIGGKKDRLSEMQTDFAEKVCQRHGLKRGLEGSKARHTQIRHWYAVIKDVLGMPKKTKTEKIKMVLSGGLDEIIQGAAAAAAESKQELERVGRYIKSLEKLKLDAKTIEEKLETLENHNKALELENQKLRKYQSNYSALKDLVDRNRDLLIQAESERFGVPLESMEQQKSAFSAEQNAQRDTPPPRALKF